MPDDTSASTRSTQRVNNLVKNQHHVWKRYLEAWTDGRNLHCWLHSQRKLVSVRPEEIAKRRFFYATSELSEGDRLYLRNLIEQFPHPQQREISQKFIDAFDYTYRLRRRLADANISDAARIEIAAELDRTEKMIGENYHSRLESDSVVFLEALRREDDSFLDDPGECGKFLYFIFNQYFRTAALRDKIVENKSLIPGHDPSRTWLIESFIYATSVGASVLAQRHEYQLLFMRNSTSTPFVAADQPVVNTLGTRDVELDLYYPLAPDLAVRLAHDPKKKLQKTRDIGVLEAERYNHLMFERSGEQTYSNNRDYLLSLTSIDKML